MLCNAPKEHKNMNGRVKIGFVPDQHIRTVDALTLQKGMCQFEDCLIIEGSMQQFKDRIDELGIEVTRGDGLHFKTGTILFSKLFIYDEFQVPNGKAYLRFGLGNSLQLAEAVPVQEMQRIVLLHDKIGILPSNLKGTQQLLLLALQRHPHCVLVQGDTADCNNIRASLETCKECGCQRFLCKPVPIGKGSWLRIGRALQHNEFRERITASDMRDAVASLALAF